MLSELPFSYFKPFIEIEGISEGSNYYRRPRILLRTIVGGLTTFFSLQAESDCTINLKIQLETELLRKGALNQRDRQQPSKSGSQSAAPSIHLITGNFGLLQKISLNGSTFLTTRDLGFID